MLKYNRFYVCITLLCIAINNTAQQVETDSSTHKVVVPGASYKKSDSYHWFWGRNHRIEWATPVRVPVLRLNTIDGGLKAYKAGGGNESKSLRLRSVKGNEYALRSIKKSRDDVIPPILKNTFLEDIVNDGVSMSHPYGAFALPVMLQHAGIYHSRPKLVYVPRQAALDSFNNKYADDLYMLEERAEGNWSEARHLGHFKSFADTEDVIAKLKEDNTHQADQHAFVKARLFDMLIADWDRHEGNWSWGIRTSSNTTWYIPVPRDRDQAFYSHDGWLINLAIKAARVSYMQNFDHRVKNIEQLNWEERDLDRFFTNALTMADWQQAAQHLQLALTDTVIEQSVKQLPPEIYAVAGRDMIEKLKSRRKQLSRFAVEYYLFLAEEVEVTGTKQREYFHVYTTPRGETMVAVYHINNRGQKEEKPWYSRLFKGNETKEIRLFGISGDDVYNVSNHSRGIRVRIIGGADRDSIMQTGRKIHVYDNANNAFQTSSAKMHYSDDTAIHKWVYHAYTYDVKGFRPTFSYNNADRFYVGINYKAINHAWRRTPFASRHDATIHYSLLQRHISVSWQALYPRVAAGWDLSLQAVYDAIRWTNFHGKGNESKFETDDFNYYRLRSEEWMASAGISRIFGKHGIDVSAFYHRIKNKNDTDRFLAKNFSSKVDLFIPYQYGGVQLTWSYYLLNDSVLPVKGFTFIANSALINNFTENEIFQRFDAKAQIFIPFGNRLSLAVRVGGATVVNNSAPNTAQYVQYAIIGGPRTLRGFRRERFWGKTAFYNNNELRYIANFRSRIMNGRIGVIGFYDMGRVWMPGENSTRLHPAYGPGFVIAPFNKFSVTITYGISKDLKTFQIRYDTLF